jgi:hypothetical protein
MYDELKKYLPEFNFNLINFKLSLKNCLRDLKSQKFRNHFKTVSEEDNIAMLLQVEWQILKTVIHYKVMRNFPDFRE